MRKPEKLIAPLKDYIWGGTRLITDWGKQTELSKVAESWELSCHKDGSSMLESGITLESYIKENKDCLGTAASRFENFPILIKLIDARDNLSVQVHPDNDYAMRVEGEYGKTEMWYIVDCDEGASLLYGFDRNVTKQEFKTAIQNNELLDMCRRVEVKKGDVFFIAAGTLHAIGSGILIAEIQQNSNTTYRVYDYGRLGADGNPRPLHVDKAIEVTDLFPPTPRPKGEKRQHEGYAKTQLASCSYFTVNLYELEREIKLIADETSFNSLLCLEGDMKLCYDGGELPIKKGDSYFVPANMGEYRIVGKGEVIVTTV